MKKAIVLLSGGIDSTVALYIAISQGYDCFPLAITYGQKHVAEVENAKRIVKHLFGTKKTLRTLHVEFPGASSLLGDGALPKNREVEDICGEISSTYVGCRNAVFLSLAGSYAEARKAEAIFVGFNYSDAQGYPVPDGRVEFLRAMELALMLGSRAGVEGRPIQLEAPLILMGKSEILETAVAHRVPLELTRSCFSDGDTPCRECDACVVRAFAFAEIGMEDPALE